MPKASKCFDCFYGLPSRCPYMFDKTKRFKGMLIQEGSVIECPKFVPSSLPATTVAGILGISTRTLSRISIAETERRLLQEGWKIRGIQGFEKTYWVVKGKKSFASLEPKPVAEPEEGSETSV